MKSSRSILLLSLLPLSAWAFMTPSSPSVSVQKSSSSSSSLVALSAKKNKKSRSSGEGFGKSAPSASNTVTEDASSDNGNAARALQSVENAAPAAPTMPPSEQLDLDPNLSPEERSQAILRQRFGLKSYEEQQADMGDYRAILDAEKKKEQRNKLRNIESIWPEDKDFVSLLPPGVIKGIDTFLKTGLGLTTVTFLIAGVFITIEAGSKATGYELPGGLEAWIETVVEPNFTPGLGVLLGFSVSLGVFTIGLGSGASSTYRENP